jgi:hypothetical protein
MRKMNYSQFLRMELLSVIENLKEMFVKQDAITISSNIAIGWS